MITNRLTFKPSNATIALSQPHRIRKGILLSDQLFEPTAPAPVRWSLATRLAFRFGFCYLLLYALCCGNACIWEIIPFHGGEHLEDWTSWPFFHGAQWLGQHWFHLTGVGAKLHDTGSGDTILNWIAVGIMLAIALTAALIWCALSEVPKARKSLAYPKLFFWFRLILRLTLGYGMLVYGFSKLFPLQMAPPSLAVLNEPLGNTSPMTMLWTLIGLNPVYEMICGAAEVAAGLLILFRRTTLLGALLTAFLTTNIVLYNFCFDVPVKLYAAHLLFMSIAVLAPDMRGLWNFFFLHKPCTPVYGWRKPARRYGLRVETVVTAVVLLLVAGQASFEMYGAYTHQLANQRHPDPVTGEWRVDSALLNGQPKPILTGDGEPLAAIFIEPTGRTMCRDTAGVLWRSGMHFDMKKHTVSLVTAGMDAPIVYAFTQPDPNHFLLTPTGADAKTAGTLALTRVPLPTHYPLLDRGFHWVNEWGLVR
jgi:uncharacterized membrane protein YphA (DoxX/SURF4 family)